MNQQQRISELQRLGWRSLMPENELGWRFFFRRYWYPNRYFAVGHCSYLTVFRNGRTADGIVETRYEREQRKKREIIFRDFRDYPWRQNA